MGAAPTIPSRLERPRCCPLPPEGVVDYGGGLPIIAWAAELMRLQATGSERLPVHWYLMPQCRGADCNGKLGILGVPVHAVVRLDSS
ncbi:hypothetical protein ACP70R_036341 [Stipagrostis hirtigluma subsp. patula]